jgi:hypothetical protein
MRSTITGWMALAALASAACAGRDGKDGAAGAHDSTAAATGASAPWVVTMQGIGPLRIDMSYAEALAVLGPDLSTPDSTAGCTELTSSRTPGGVSMLLVNDSIARVDVSRPGVRTAEGTQVGDTEDDVKRAYGAAVTVSPHKYTNGHYLTVRPAAPADSNFRFVFETDGRVVTEYRAGRLPVVEWVEGCS